MNGCKNSPKLPRLEIIEQPAPKALRFRYECEGRSAGSIPGVHSTSENRTYPTIRLVGYEENDDVVIVVSCVTKNEPYLTHPHNLVGKGCDGGVCSVTLDRSTMTATFSNLGIQCVKKRDIPKALQTRHEKKVDPFIKGFDHVNNPSSIDLNCVRLCFQAISKGIKFKMLDTVVSDPVYDKKAMSDLLITKLSHASASVRGGLEMILLCEKITKEDIKVRFYEEKHGHEVWEAFADILLVHKQVAIAFKTPAYYNLEVYEKVPVFIQLYRPSDKACSEPVQFYFTSDSGGLTPGKRQLGAHPTTKRPRTVDDLLSNHVLPSIFDINKPSTSHQFPIKTEPPSTPSSPYHNQNAYSPSGTPGPSEPTQFMPMSGPSPLPRFEDTWQQIPPIGITNMTTLVGGTFTAPQFSSPAHWSILRDIDPLDQNLISDYTNPQSALPEPLNQYGAAVNVLNNDEAGTSADMASVERYVEESDLIGTNVAVPVNNADPTIQNEAEQQLVDNFNNSMSISGDIRDSFINRLVNETFETQFNNKN